jgi:hypothetical protein
LVSDFTKANGLKRGIYDIVPTRTVARIFSKSYAGKIVMKVELKMEAQKYQSEI